MCKKKECKFRKFLGKIVEILKGLFPYTLYRSIEKIVSFFVFVFSFLIKQNYGTFTGRLFENTN